MSEATDVAIVGAGPYGLSIAAHLRSAGVRFRIFGSPMRTWFERMPNGMLLKADGFASNLGDPDAAFTLKRYCLSAGVPYDDLRLPVRLETFRAYGLAFQRRLVPDLEDVQVDKVERRTPGFHLALSDGRHATAHNVVLAVGISHFHALPPALMHLPADLVTHGSAHAEVERFRGREVTVIGGGASAIDLAVLLKDAGARVVLVARRPSLRFNDPPIAQRSLWTKLRRPSSTIGPGWKPLAYTKAPGLFYRLPWAVRRRIFATFAPSAGWPMKERFVGRVPVLLGRHIEKAEIRNDRVWLLLSGQGPGTEHVADHVIAATGYRVDMRRVSFLDEEILSGIHVADHAPVLSPHFETSIPGLYVVGFASKYCFGPVMQFACGARWTAARISRRLAKAQGHRRWVAAPERAAVRGDARA